MARRIAIYDLDRTVTVKPTFTRFLAFAARRRAAWRLAFAPVWAAALIGYKLKFYPREPMKAFGVRLFIGARFSDAVRDDLAQAFAAAEVHDNIAPGALRTMAADRAAGAALVLLSAAPDIYAPIIAQNLGFDDCIATRHGRADTDWLAAIDGRNNYGAEKVRRVEAWLSAQGIERADCHITAYSDHASDAPIFNFADEAVLVGRHHAPQSGWRQEDWER
jgi:phosphatidylglycerophosphatase C